MAIEHDMQKRSSQLVQQIENAEKQGKPIDTLVKQHINLLEEFHDVFVKKAERENYAPMDKITGEIQIYGNMKAWAKKIGLPIEKYDKIIYDLRVSLFGKERTESYFHDQG